LINDIELALRILIRNVQTKNIETFLLFVEYLMKLGFYKEDIADVIENFFD